MSAQVKLNAMVSGMLVLQFAQILVIRILVLAVAVVVLGILQIYFVMYARKLKPSVIFGKDFLINMSRLFFNFFNSYSIIVVVNGLLRPARIVYQVPLHAQTLSAVVFGQVLVLSAMKTQLNASNVVVFGRIPDVTCATKIKSLVRNGK
jgi:hypothetical protein